MARRRRVALLCELADPPLSSVIPDCRRAGYQAAHLLDRWLEGEEISRGARLVEVGLPPSVFRARAQGLAE